MANNRERKPISIFNHVEKKDDRRRFYEVRNMDQAVPEILIYDEIDSMFGINAAMIIYDLQQMGSREKIIVRISSPGGDAQEAANIYNALVRNPAKIHVAIDGQALSAAATIALAGDTVSMSQNALLMYHEPFTRVTGNAAKMRNIAAILDKASDAIAGSMSDANRKGLTFEQAKQIMIGEVDGTWYTAAEALEAGFVDELTSNLRIAAHFDPGKFSGVPAAILAKNDEKLARSAEVKSRLAKVLEFKA
jgi:ATP-dependent Clp protease protease subunit